MNRRDTIRQELTQPNPGGPDVAEWHTFCKHCDRRITDQGNVWECTHCKKQICPRCAHVTDNLRERFCTEVIDQGCDPPLYNVTDCLEHWYDKKLAEADDKLFDQGELIKKLQSDLSERLT